MKTPTILRRLFLVVLLAGALLPTGATAAHDPQLRGAAERIAGGASLMRELSRDDKVDVFHERARRFAALAEAGADREDLVQEWRRLRAAYRSARRESRRSGDEGWRFLAAHLDEDFAAANRALGNVPDDDESYVPGDARRLSLVRDEICVGRNKTAHACPNRREAITFTLPRDVAVLRRLDTEWRDFGDNANGEIYLNDRLLWRQDVRRDWDGDGKELNVRVPAGSVLTVRSANGDPIWIRKLTLEVLERADRDDYRDPWNLPYDPWR